MDCLDRFLGSFGNFLPDAKIFRGIWTVLGLLQGGDVAKGDGVAPEDQKMGGLGVVNTRQVI